LNSFLLISIPFFLNYKSISSLDSGFIGLTSLEM